MISSDWWPMYRETPCSEWAEWIFWADEELFLLTDGHPNARCKSITSNQPCETCSAMTHGTDSFYGWRISQLANTGIFPKDDPVLIRDRRARMDFRPVFSTPNADEPLSPLPDN